MNSKLKNAIAVMVNKSGILWILKRFDKRGGVRILMYHKVKKNLFEKQVKYLTETFNVVSLGDALDMLSGHKSIPPRVVVLTFDDGYRNFLTDAYPVLKKFNLPATVFLTCDFIDNKSMAWWDKVNLSNSKYSIEKLKKLPHKVRLDIVKSLKMKKSISEEDVFLRLRDIRKMSDVINYGSHTVTHPILTTMEDDDAKAEIQKSRKVLEKLLKDKILDFCYPNGSFSEKIKEMVIDAGYRSACTTIKGRNYKGCDLFALKRIGISDGDNQDIFAFKLAVL